MVVCGMNANLEGMPTARNANVEGMPIHQSKPSKKLNQECKYKWVKQVFEFLNTSLIWIIALDIYLFMNDLSP